MTLDKCINVVLPKKSQPLLFGQYICHFFPLTDFSHTWKKKRSEGGEAATNSKRVSITVFVEGNKSSVSEWGKMSVVDHKLPKAYLF